MQHPHRPVILILDDNVIVREILSERLGGDGYDVVSLASAFQIGTALQDYRPDAALIDVSMPALDGDKLVQILTRQRNDAGGQGACFLILYSDRDETDLAALAEASGADGFVSKAAGYDKLLHCLQGFVGAPA